MFLYGASGHAKVVIDCLLDLGHEITGIFDDYSDLMSLNGYDVLGEYDKEEDPDQQIVVTVGDNITRKKIVEHVIHKFSPAIVHPSASVSRYSHIGEGTVVFHRSVIQSGSQIGKCCIINTASSVDHDCILEDYVHISPNVTLCGKVKVAEGTHIGAGATVIPEVSIGKWCVIGAGAVITQNLPDYSLVVGVPGKVIRKVEVK